MLVTSIFFFSHNVFKRILSKDGERSGLCGEELTWSLGQNKEKCCLHSGSQFLLN